MYSVVHIDTYGVYIIKLPARTKLVFSISV